MKCPLFAIASKEQERRGFLTHIDCIKEECAWWDKQNDQCAVLTLGTGLWLVNKELLELLQKMPHEEQFWK